MISFVGTLRYFYLKKNYFQGSFVVAFYATLVNQKKKLSRNIEI